MSENLKTGNLANTSTTSHLGAEAEIAGVKARVFARRWSIGERTVSRLLTRGLPHIAIGPRLTRIPLLEGDRWIKEHYLVKRLKHLR